MDSANAPKPLGGPGIAAPALASTVYFTLKIQPFLKGLADAKKLSKYFTDITSVGGVEMKVQEIPRSLGH
jgi:hypothetical protein